MDEQYPETKKRARWERQNAVASGLIVMGNLTGSPGVIRDPDVVAPLIRQAIEKYAREHHPVGDFLQAVLADEFSNAARRADPYNAATLSAIAFLVEDVVPVAARGSRHAYTAWVRAWRGEPASEQAAPPGPPMG